MSIINVVGCSTFLVSAIQTQNSYVGITRNFTSAACISNRTPWSTVLYSSFLRLQLWFSNYFWHFALLDTLTWWTSRYLRHMMPTASFSVSPRTLVGLFISDLRRCISVGMTTQYLYVVGWRQNITWFRLMRRTRQSAFIRTKMEKSNSLNFKKWPMDKATCVTKWLRRQNPALGFQRDDTCIRQDALSEDQKGGTGPLRFTIHCN